MTQNDADREAAGAIRTALYRECPDMPSYPIGIVEPILTRHREASTAALMGEVERLKAWHTPLGGLIEARQVCQDAYCRIEKAKSINGHVPGHPYDVALSALNSALGQLAVLVDAPVLPPATLSTTDQIGGVFVEQPGMFDKGGDAVREALGEAIGLIQEAKGIADGEKGGAVTDHLDFAESWIDKALATLAKHGGAEA